MASTTSKKAKLPLFGKSTISDYIKDLKEQAEDLVLNVFPEKSLYLDNILKTEELFSKAICSVHGQLNIPIPDPLSVSHDDDDFSVKKRKYDSFVAEPNQLKILLLTNGLVPSNSHIVGVVELVKPIIQRLLEDTNCLKMWIRFLTPKIEDGNNFGVSVQEDALEEIQYVETKASGYFDKIKSYFFTRAKFVAKVAENPHVEDFRRTVREHDENEFLNLRLMVGEMRNHYASLHDMITKNLEKIKHPKTSQTDTMF